MSARGQHSATTHSGRTFSVAFDCVRSTQLSISFLPLLSDSLHSRASNRSARYVQLLLSGLTKKLLPVSSPNVIQSK